MTVIALAMLSMNAIFACATPDLAPAQPAQTPKRTGEFRREHDPDLIARGHRLVVRECASRHAIDHKSKGPNPDALPTNTVLSRYDSNARADDFMNGAHIGVEPMPLFDFSVIALMHASSVWGRARRIPDKRPFWIASIDRNGCVRPGRPRRRLCPRN